MSDLWGLHIAADGKEPSWKFWEAHDEDYSWDDGPVIPTTGKWYHVSKHDLPVGTKLIPGGGDSQWEDWYQSEPNQSPERRANWVWMEPDLEGADQWTDRQNGSHVYEVEPIHDPHPWNGTGQHGYVADSATILRKVDLEEVENGWSKEASTDEIRLAISQHDVYDSYYDDEFDPEDPAEPHDGPWYHYSPHSLPVGTHLTTGHPSPWGDDLYEKDGTEHRRNYVWLSPSLHEAVGWAELTPRRGQPGPGHIYRVEPISDVLPWNGSGSDGWVADGAHIAEEIPHPWKEPHTASTHGIRYAAPRRWVHISPHELEPGTVLTPGGGKSIYDTDENSWYGAHNEQDRRNWVWLDTHRDHANWVDILMDDLTPPDGGKPPPIHAYEVQPHEPPWEWGEGGQGYVTPAATVVKRIRTYRFDPDDHDGIRYAHVVEADVAEDLMRLAAMNENLINRLHDEFHQWWDKNGEEPENFFGEWEEDEDGNFGDPNSFATRGPLGHWPSIEKFLKEKYPAAHKDLEFGDEEATAGLDGRWAGDEYETGPHAEAKHGYDPKEIASAMLLLHNSSHPGRGYLEHVDKARLDDIDKKRQQNLQDVFDRHEPIQGDMSQSDVDMLHGIAQTRHRQQQVYDQRNARLAMAWQDWAPHIQGGCKSCTHRDDGNGSHGEYWIEHEPTSGPIPGDALAGGKLVSNLSFFHDVGRDGVPELFIAGIHTSSGHRNDGVAEALMRRMHEDHPNTRINPGFMTDDGQAFHDKMLERDPSAKSVLARLAMPMPMPEGVTFHHHPTNDTIPTDPWPADPSQLVPRFSSPAVEARHNGETVGYLEWDPPLHATVVNGIQYGDHPPEVSMIKVHPDYRRHGIGTALFDFARQHQGDLEHSDSRTGLGNKWVDYEQGRAKTAMSHDDDDDEEENYDEWGERIPNWPKDMVQHLQNKSPESAYSAGYSAQSHPDFYEWDIYDIPSSTKKSWEIAGGHNLDDFEEGIIDGKINRPHKYKDPQGHQKDISKRQKEISQKHPGIQNYVQMNNEADSWNPDDDVFDPREFNASQRTAMPYYHNTDAELNPGDMLLPAAERGHHSRWRGTEDEPYPHYDPHSVYMYNEHGNPDFYQGYGKNRYEVEPVGIIQRDPEWDLNRRQHAEWIAQDEGINTDDAYGLFNDEDVDGFADHTAPRARIIRKINGHRLAMPALARLAAAVGEDLLGRLHDEFHDWLGDGDGGKIDGEDSGDDDFITRQIQKMIDAGADIKMPSAPKGVAQHDENPLGSWPTIEQFIKDRYPAAHRPGFYMGMEQAQPLLDGRGMFGDPVPDEDPYETGPEAVAKYGYDPKEIAAGMLLLHNRAHGHRSDLEDADLDRLTDITRIRSQQQRAYEHHQRQPVTARTAAPNDLVTIYHGTTEDRAQAILDGQRFHSHAGAWFTTDPERAKAYGSAVIATEVPARRIPSWTSPRGNPEFYVPRSTRLLTRGPFRRHPG